MTKQPAPLSIDAALAHIAGQVPGDWAAMARAVGYSESTVRKWGNRSEKQEINFPAAVKLDILFQQHGGTGRPIYEAYGLLVGAATASTFADQFDIMRRMADWAKEIGEAEEAVIRFALPEADDGARAKALRELIDVKRVVDGLLLTLEAGVSAAELPRSDLPAPELHARAPP